MATDEYSEQIMYITNVYMVSESKTVSLCV